MMNFCCDYIPKNKAGNDFSVRELISCINEIEKSNAADEETVNGWKNKLASIIPEECYTIYATSPEEKPNNWALFTAVSEYFRQKAGLCESNEFIDMQLASQFKRIDEDGLYMDGREIGFTLPAFYFDGEVYTEIAVSESSLTVSYEGWQCRYTTDGKITDLEKTAKNRNGYYKAFLASAKSRLYIKIEIIKL